MQPDTAWKRMKLIEKEVEKLIEKIKPLCVDGKSHEDVCRDYIRQQYVSSLDGASAAFSSMTAQQTLFSVRFIRRLYQVKRGSPFPPTGTTPSPFPPTGSTPTTTFS